MKLKLKRSPRLSTKPTGIASKQRRCCRSATRPSYTKSGNTVSHRARAITSLVDLHAGLVVRGGAERLALRGRDGGVALDQRRHHPTERFNAERERRHVQQEDILDLALEHAGLD